MASVGLEDAFSEWAAESLEMSQRFESDGPILHTLEEAAEEYGIPLDELRAEA